MKFESKRLQFTAQWLTPAFAFIATFIAISNSLGFERALYLAVIVALFGWIIANQLVHGTPLVQPQPTTALPSTPGGYPIGCSNCSSAMSFHPPDSRHIVLLMNPCD